MAADTIGTGVVIIKVDYSDFTKSMTKVSSDASKQGLNIGKKLADGI